MAESAGEPPEIIAGTAESIEAPPGNVQVRVEDDAGHARDVSVRHEDAARSPMCASGDAGERSGALRLECPAVSSARAATRSQS
jgi:hypothetical protein